MPEGRRDSAPRQEQKRSPRRQAKATQFDAQRVKEITAEAVQSALQPKLQTIAAWQQQQQQQSLPPLRKPTFIAVQSALQQLPTAIQEHLQPFYRALRQADSIEPEEQALKAVHVVIKFASDNPNASEAEAPAPGSNCNRGRRRSLWQLADFSTLPVPAGRRPGSQHSADFDGHTLPGSLRAQIGCLLPLRASRTL